MIKKLAFNDLEILLLPQKAVYIPAYRMLIIADWHLGKMAHFRKEGIFVPEIRPEQELNRLGSLIDLLPARKVVFLGDLFHSDWNREWNDLAAYLASFNEIEFILTKGNHDILAERHWNAATISLRSQLLLPEGIVLTHQQVDKLEPGMFNITGHVHPGCMLQTKGRQRYRLPCFYLENRTLILPAFGKYTGLQIMRNTADARIFAIIHNEVIAI